MSGWPAVTVVDATAVQLEPDLIDPATILSGSANAAAGEIATWSDDTETGVWRCEPGVFTDVEVEETFVVLAGRASIEHEGTTHHLGPGSVCVFAEGARTTWTVHETLLKVFVIRG